jgi:hypothetical protein
MGFAARAGPRPDPSSFSTRRKVEPAVALGPAGPPSRPVGSNASSRREGGV